MARHQESDAFTAEDRRLIEELARRAAVELDNGALQQDAQRAIAVRENVLRVVAHDLRNPFSTINLATSRLAQSAPRLPADLHEVPEVIKPYVRRGNRMIGDLLDTAQIAAGKLKVRAAPSAPARTISAVVATHRPLIDEHELTLEVAVMEGLPVLGNLLGNAIKFTPAGGQIKRQVEDGDGCVDFSVSDSRPGLSRADQREVFSLFQKFQKARPEDRQGGGLGLKIARGLVEAHGGAIWVESEESAGATFRFTLRTTARPGPAEATFAG